MSDTKDDLALDLFIQATTLGQVKSYLPFKLTIVSPYTGLNFPPIFTEILERVNLVYILGSDVDDFYQILPQIIDIENDDYSV